VQSTSIPGVAQRTGATTYYLELLPVPRHALSERRPVLALTPGIGDIDVFLASELLEAARAAASGFITADRTRVIASTSRAYAMQEKTAMGDGRLHSERLIGAVTHHAREAVLFDMTALAKECGSFVNAVMLGALAGRGALPIPAAAFEAAIRADGKAVESNLRGFRAGLAAAQGQGRPQTAPLGHRIEAGMEGAALEGRIAAAPALAQAVMREGVRRLTAYQDSAYAALYLDRLTPIADAEAAAGGDGSLLRETARHLALRMAFEDVIRVAQVKSDPARLARIRAELGAGAGEPYRIVEFLKPGIEEMCSLLPPRLARRILAAAERRGLLARLHWGMEVPTTAVGGYLRLRLLAALRRLRRYSHRFAEEQAQIDSWLALVRGAATRSLALAREVAECARLIKGYGDTHKRGLGNYRRIEAEIIRPALAGTMPPAFAADAVASARTAALADPEGETLTRCLAEIARSLDCRIAAE
jgi:indolepyruvate ferredoxin oxidoreductase beta subunit